MRSGSFSTIAAFLRNDPGFADVQNIFYTSIQLAKLSLRSSFSSGDYALFCAREGVRKMLVPPARRG